MAIRARSVSVMCGVLLAGSAAFGQDASLSEQANLALGLQASEIVFPALEGEIGAPLVATFEHGEEVFTLALAPHSVRADGYQLLVQGEDGTLSPVDAGIERTLRGEVVEEVGSRVAGSYLDSGLHARINLASGEEFWLEPLVGRVEGGDDAYVFYRTADVLSGHGTCESTAEHTIDPVPGRMLQRTEPSDDSVGTAALCVAEIACDADYPYFQDYGSVTAVENRISSIINSVNSQYESEVGITHTITAIVVRTDRRDPYKGKGASRLLNQFRSEWENNQGHIQRDMAHLFTGTGLSGTTIGIAWVGAVCTSYGYGLSESDFDNNFACVTDLTSHEMGHNWGAGHCSCQNYTMNSFITCANTFNPSATIPAITSFRDSRTCLDGCN